MIWLFCSVNQSWARALSHLEGAEISSVLKPSQRRSEPRIIISFIMGLAILLVALFGCRKKVPEVVPKTAQQAAMELQKAAKAGRLERLFKLLDTQSQWSIMSVYKDQRETCNLIRSYYPQEKQARALKRCVTALKIGTPEAFFAAWALKHKQQVVEPLKQFDAASSQYKKGQNQVELQDGKTKLLICKERGQKKELRWSYCGLRDQLAQMKVKAARDLTSVKENAAAFRQ